MSLSSTICHCGLRVLCECCDDDVGRKQLVEYVGRPGRLPARAQLQTLLIHHLHGLRRNARRCWRHRQQLSFCRLLEESIKSSTLFLFQWPSLIDSALLLTVLPLYPMESFVVYTGWLQGYWAIRPYVFVYLWPLSLTAQTATIWVTVLVAVTRYIAICLPFRASLLCTVSNAKKQLAFVLLSAVLFEIPNFIEYRVL